MASERNRERNRNRNEKEKSVIVDDMIREDCPCPKTGCKNFKHCGPCRAKHSPPKKSLPYCERQKKK